MAAQSEARCPACGQLIPTQNQRNTQRNYRSELIALMIIASFMGSMIAVYNYTHNSLFLHLGQSAIFTFGSAIYTVVEANKIFRSKQHGISWSKLKLDLALVILFPVLGTIILIAALHS